MADNSIQPWANGDGANRLTEAAYKRLDKSQGFTKGTASSEQANTLWAANSLVASAFSQFSADGSDTDVTSDMDRDDLVSAFKAALSDFMLNGAGSTPMTQMPVGTPITWHSDDIPAGTLLMNGQSIDADKYPKLHDVYGDKLPDWRGYFLRAADGGRGVDETSERKAGSTQDSANKEHNHTGKTGEAGAHTPSGDVTNVEGHVHEMDDYAGAFAETDYDVDPPAGWDGRTDVGGSVLAAEGSSHSGKWAVYKTHSTKEAGAQEMGFTGHSVDAHVHTINNDGGKESRPQNIAVNYIVVAA